MTTVARGPSTGPDQTRSLVTGSRFRAVLVASTIVPNLKVFSATNSFQPLALPLIVGYSVLTGRISPIAVRFLYFFLLTTVVLTFLHGDLNPTTPLYTALYLSGPLTLIYLLGIRSDEHRGLAIVLQGGLILCFASVAEQFLIGSKALDDVWSILFANHQEATEFGLRGASGFTSEPSHVGRLFVTLLFLACILKIRGWRTWIVLAIPFVVMNRSASAFLLLVGLIAALLYRRSKVWLAIAIAGAMLTFPYFAGLDYRFIQAVERAWTALTSGDAQPIVGLLGTAGGRRAIQTAVGYVSLVYYPLGHGVASYLTDFRDVAASMGFALSDFGTYETLDTLNADLKPSSYLSQIAYDYGLLGLIPVAAFVLNLRKEYCAAREPVALMCLALGVLQLVVASTTTEPWPWVMIAAGLVQRSDQKVETTSASGDHG